jgi:hypothetical protein
MVALPQSYDTASLPDTGGALPLIEPGQYQAVIVKSEFKETSKKTGSYLELTNVITQGQHKGTEFIERLNIVNQNPQAVEIAYKTLARISEAVGMTRTPNDSNELHNKPFIMEIGTEAGTEYTDNQGAKKMGKDKSIIKKYLPLPGAGFAGSHSGAASPSPFTTQPAANTTTPPASSPFAPEVNPFKS